MRAISKHIRGNVVAYLALFIALGGSAWAAATIGPRDIKKNAVRAKHVKDGQIGTAEVANDTDPKALTGADIAANSVGGTDVSEDSLFNDNSLTGEDVARDGIGGEDVDEGTLFNDDSLTGQDVATNGIGGDDVDEGTLFNDDSLTGQDVATNSIGGDDVDEGTLFNDNSLGGQDIDESSLGQVPSAAAASTVGGVTVFKVGYFGAPSSGVQTIFDAAGLKLTAACEGTDIELDATTTKDDSAIYLTSVDSDVNDNTAGSDLENTAFDTGVTVEVEDVLLGGDAENATIQYHALDGAVATLELALDGGNPQGCQATGVGFAG